MLKILGLSILLAAVVALVNCGGAQAVSNTANDAPLQNPGDTPTAAYKRLFAAVKSNNTAAIKAEVSETTQKMAGFLAARQNAPIEKVYGSGFTATTHSPTLPDIRDERVNGKMGALEVWNSQDSQWEDLPFIREPSGWKLAVGDAFSNSYVSPGKGMAEKEREAANAADPNHGLNVGPLRANSNVKTAGAPKPFPQPRANK